MYIVKSVTLFKRATRVLMCEYDSCVSIFQMNVDHPGFYHFFPFPVTGSPCSQLDCHQLSSTGSGPWTGYKMRDFSALPKCVCAAAISRASPGLETGRHRAPCLRPTRRPSRASAPCLKSLPWCHLPSCSHMQPRPEQQASQTRGPRRKQLVGSRAGNMRFLLRWQQQWFLLDCGSLWLNFIFTKAVATSARNNSYWRHLTFMCCLDFLLT